VIGAFIIAGCVLFGLMVGRWWAVLAALPLGVLGAVVIDAWEVSKLYVGCVWAVFGGGGIALGVAIRKLTGIVSAGRERKQAWLS